MSRKTLVISLASLSLVACASTRTLEVVSNESAPAPAVTAADPTTAPVVPAGLRVVEPREPLAPALGLAAAPAADGAHQSRFTLKGGYYGADEDALDDGYIFNVSWMRFFTRFFALELEAGYLDADGEDEGVEAEVWSVPVMLNGRFNVPVWVLDLYAGVGLGGFYYDAETSGAVVAEDDGFLWGGNGFVGGTVNLAEAISLGIEGKYYVTDDIGDLDDASLDAFALMLTLGFSR